MARRKRRNYEVLMISKSKFSYGSEDWRDREDKRSGV
jgi:hypothetical protein